MSLYIQKQAAMSLIFQTKLQVFVVCTVCTVSTDCLIENKFYQICRILFHVGNNPLRIHIKQRCIIFAGITFSHGLKFFSKTAIPIHITNSKNHTIHFLYISHGFTYCFTYCFSTETIVPENASTSESSPVYVTFTLSPTETFSNPCGFASKLNS